MIWSTKRKPHGFATITFLVLISLILVITFSFLLITHIQLLKSEIRSLCIQGSVAIQKSIIRSEKKLFSYNSLSTYLSTQLVLAYAELALAAETENGVAVAIALEKIKYLESEQLKLDTLQKNIILSTQAAIGIATKSLLLAIETRLYYLGNNWNYYLTADKKINILHFPIMAVRPDSVALAPNYRLDLNHNKTQTLAFHWQYNFETKKSSQEVLVANNSYSFVCGAGLSKKGEKWKIEINEGKF